MGIAALHPSYVCRYSFVAWQILVKKCEELSHPKNRSCHYANPLQIRQVRVDVMDWAHIPASFHREIERANVVVQEGRE